MAAEQDVASPEPGQKWRRGFWALILTQFQSAFNENGLKNLVIFLILAMGIEKDQRDWLVFLVGAMFALPFILFSMTGGYLADRFSKRTVTIGTKLFEIIVFVFAGFALARQDRNMMLAAVFLASTENALFGPSKYGLLPELLETRTYPGGTAFSCLLASPRCSCVYQPAEDRTVRS